MISVIGAGIAGSIVTRLLRKRGHQVRVFDDGDVLAGSRASSNLYVASWLKKFGSSSAALGIEVLESLFPQELIDQPFSRGIADAAKVRHIAQRHLLVEPDEVGTVKGIVVDKDPIVLCTGYRTELWPANVPKPEVLVGHCLHIHGELEPGQSSLTMPLPYKHHKLYQMAPGVIYFANSTALKLSSFEKRKDELKAKLIEQAEAALGRKITVCSYLVGYRPCIPGHEFGELRTLAPGAWSVNGGGKNGMVAYAALAHRLAEEIGTP